MARRLNILIGKFGLKGNALAIYGARHCHPIFAFDADISKLDHTKHWGMYLAQANIRSMQIKSHFCKR